jgi:hypothetical protein
VIPRLTVAPIDADTIPHAPHLGATFRSLLGTELVRLAQGEPEQGPHLVRGELGPAEVQADVRELARSGGTRLHRAVGAMWRVSPSTRLTVGGRLFVDEAGRMGFAARLSRGKRVIAAETLHLSELHAAPSVRSRQEHARTGHHALAEAAAVWALYHLPCDRTGRSFSLLGTADWRAYALFRSAHRQRSPERAMHFAMALVHDPEFAAALANLGTELLWIGSDVELERAKELLQEAYALTATHAPGSLDPTPFTTKYSLSTVYATLGDPARASKYARELIASIERAADSTDVPPELRAYLDRIRPCARILLATVSGDCEELARLTKDEQFSPSARTQYSLACAWAFLARRDAVARPEAESRCLQHLSRSIALAEGPRRWARRDRTLEWVRTSRSTEHAFAELVGPPA